MLQTVKNIEPSKLLSLIQTKIALTLISPLTHTGKCLLEFLKCGTNG